MTIDEAIALVNIEKECINRADNCNRKCNECDLVQDTNNLLDLYEQIAEWLEELKAYRTLDKTNFSDGYNKAIDDFADRLSEYLNVKNATKYGNKNAEQQRNSYDTLMKYEIADGIDDVAEQLKAGGEDE